MLFALLFIGGTLAYAATRRDWALVSIEGRSDVPSLAARQSLVRGQRVLLAAVSPDGTLSALVAMLVVGIPSDSPNGLYTGLCEDSAHTTFAVGRWYEFSPSNVAGIV